MKQHIRFLTVILTLALLATLTSCWLLEDPFEEGQTDLDGMTIGEILPDTDISIGIPIETTTKIAEEPEPEITTEPAPDIREMWGTVVEYKATDPMPNVISVRTYVEGNQQTIHLLVADSTAFCVGDEVEFSFDAGKPMESYDGYNVYEAITIDFVPMAVPEKPVIYLYPETPTEVSVKLTLDGKLTSTYPAYDKGWDNFTAHPDGTLIFPDGKEYYCLYWEGIQNMDCDFTRGFCVKGEDTAAFLEWALTEQGLTPREANEFIIYWLPRMESNPYNVISFQTDAYTEGAVLEIDPNPDSLLRVFMAYYPSDEAVEMEAQAFTPFERVGFAVVEWGGCELIQP